MRRRREGALASQVVLVTGASSGIGRATARALARCGADVALLARAPESLAAAEQECRQAGGRTLVLPSDVADAAAIDRAFDQTVHEFGRVDAVVHSAAVLAYGRFEDVPVDVFDTTQRVTVLGTANVARSALRCFRQQGRGRLVVVGSLLGKVCTPYMSSYVTAKWAIHGLVRTLQIEARQTPGIEISLVSPGGVDTPIYAQAGSYMGWQGRPPPPIDPPEKVARAILRVLVRPQRERSVGLANAVTVLGFRLLPGVFDRAVTPLMHAGGLSRRAVGPTPGNVMTPQPDGDAAHGRWGRHWLRPVLLAATAAGAVMARIAYRRPR